MSVAFPGAIGRSAPREEVCRRLLDTLREIEIPVTTKRYGCGEVVYRVDEEGRALHFLLEGAVKLSAGYSGLVGGKEATLRLLGPWEVFGYPVFARERARLASAEAFADCEVAKVPRIFLERAVRRRPEVAFEMATLSDMRLAEYEELVWCLLARRTEVKLAPGCCRSWPASSASLALAGRWPSGSV